MPPQKFVLGGKGMYRPRRRVEVEFVDVRLDEEPAAKVELVDPHQVALDQPVHLAAQCQRALRPEEHIHLRVPIA